MFGFIWLIIRQTQAKNQLNKNPNRAKFLFGFSTDSADFPSHPIPSRESSSASSAFPLFLLGIFREIRSNLVGKREAIYTVVRPLVCHVLLCFSVRVARAVDSLSFRGISQIHSTKYHDGVDVKRCTKWLFDLYCHGLSP